ncbi:unnamed protein product [Symbiodinium sp. CCMP2592]|nr:unnamed protein product [Symbiodinium sp. CCMP2592]
MLTVLPRPSSWQAAKGVPTTERKPAPAFDPQSSGGPSEWNLADHALPASPDRVLIWGAKARSQLPQPPCAPACTLDVERFLQSFFRTRQGPDGTSLTTLLGDPAPQPDGWWRIPWTLLGPSHCELLCQDGWLRGWHGCKMEALYSIVYHGQLLPSTDESKGDRFLAGCPGVYLHRDSLQHKVENYMRWIPLCGDGLFWAAKWEVVYAPSGSNKHGKRTDQVIQSAESVELVALWLSVRSENMLPDGTAVQAKWTPAREANPCLTELKRRSSALLQTVDFTELSASSRPSPSSSLRSDLVLDNKGRLKPTPKARGRLSHIPSELEKDRTPEQAKLTIQSGNLVLKSATANSSETPTASTTVSAATSAVPSDLPQRGPKRARSDASSPKPRKMQTRPKPRRSIWFDVTDNPADQPPSTSSAAAKGRGTGTIKAAKLQDRVRRRMARKMEEIFQANSLAYRWLRKTKMTQVGSLLTDLCCSLHQSLPATFVLNAQCAHPPQCQSGSHGPTVPPHTVMIIDVPSVFATGRRPVGRAGITSGHLPVQFVQDIPGTWLAYRLAVLPSVDYESIQSDPGHDDVDLGSAICTPPAHYSSAKRSYKRALRRAAQDQAERRMQQAALKVSQGRLLFLSWNAGGLSQVAPQFPTATWDVYTSPTTDNKSAGLLVQHLRILHDQWAVDLLHIYQKPHNSHPLALQSSKTIRLAVWECIGKILAALPARNTVIMLGDFNTQIKPCAAAGTRICSGTSTGTHPPDQARLQHLVEDFSLLHLNSWCKAAGPTYHHNKGASLIDHIIMRSSQADDRARQARPLRLGLAAWRLGGYHLPLKASVPLQRFHTLNKPVAPQRAWDHWGLIQVCRSTWDPRVQSLRSAVQASLPGVNDLGQLHDTLIHCASQSFPPPAGQHRLALWQTPPMQDGIRSMWQAYRVWKTAKAQDQHNPLYVSRCYHHFKTAHKAFRRAGKEAKKHWFHGRLQELQAAASSGDSRKLYAGIRTLAPKSSKPKVQLRDSGGHLQDPKTQLKQLETHYRKLYAADEDTSIQGPQRTPIHIEVTEAEMFLADQAQFAYLPGAQLSLDLSSAFDLMDWRLLDKALLASEVPAELRHQIMSWHSEISYVLTHLGHTAKVEAQRGLRQGCKLAPLLWTLALAQIYRELLAEGDPLLTAPWLEQSSTIYADDIHLKDTVQTTRELDDMVYRFSKILDALAAHGMVINSAKSALLLRHKGSFIRGWLRRHLIPKPEGDLLRFRSPLGTVYEIPLRDHHTYLGIRISYHSQAKQAVTYRLQAANQAWQRLRGVLCSTRHLAQTHRLSLWKSTVLPTLLYGIAASNPGAKDIQRTQHMMTKQVRAITRSFAHLQKESTQDLLHRCSLSTILEHLQREAAALHRSLTSLSTETSFVTQAQVESARDTAATLHLQVQRQWQVPLGDTEGITDPAVHQCMHMEQKDFQRADTAPIPSDNGTAPLRRAMRLFLFISNLMFLRHYVHAGGLTSLRNRRSTRISSTTARCVTSG